MPVKSKVEVLENFVAFSEYTNFEMSSLEFKSWIDSKLKSQDIVSIHRNSYFLYHTREK